MVFPRIFRDFRRLIEAIEHLYLAVKELAHVQQQLGPAVDRLEALELSRHHFEAEISGVLLKAEGKLKAANNSEARERQLKKSYDIRTDPLYQDGEEPEAGGDTVPVLDAAGGEAERMQALRLDVAPNHRETALRRKWGVTA